MTAAVATTGRFVGKPRIAKPVVAAIPDAPLPRNVEAERCALGTLFLGADYNSMLDILGTDPAVFTNDQHAKLWGHLLKYPPPETGYDAALLREQLGTDFDLLGGYDFLKWLVEGVASAKRAREYAETVARLYRRRDYIRKNYKALLAAYDPDVHEDQLAELANEARLAAPTGGGGEILECFADIEPQDLRWLWPARIPLGKLTTISGDPGLGKSFLTLDIAARVSRGIAISGFPGHSEPSGRRDLVIRRG